MLYQTDNTLFESAITISALVKNAKDLAVLADKNLFGVIEFVHACRKNNIKPIIGLQKEIGSANYLLIALNKDGYQSLLLGESEGFDNSIFSNKNVMSILVEVRGDDYVVTQYGINSNNLESNAIIASEVQDFLPSKIINGFKESDIYTLGMVKAIGDKSSFEKSTLLVDFNIESDDTQLKEILSNVEDFLQLGNPQPPRFKFLEKYAEIENVSIDEDVLFTHLCFKGLEKRCKKDNLEYVNRLSWEIDVIKQMKFPGYMLIVWEFVNKAKEMGIAVGPGRGSAAGSLVAYSLGITDIDPLPYGLLFERFLNPERVSFPDIDMDFAQDGRQKIIDYVTEAYGQEFVSQVITFSKMNGKSSIRDAARVLQCPLALADKMAKEIPDLTTLPKAYEENKAFWDKWTSEDFQAKKIFDGALSLSGFKRNLGIHAAGLIIGSEKINTRAPVYKIDEASVVGFEGTYLEDVNLVKFDFLGLKTLDVIANANRLILNNKNIEIDWEKIDVQDKGVYETIRQGNTMGMFQIESAGMQNLNKRLMPDRFEDLIAVLALYRPGPMESGMLDSFVERKHGREKIQYTFDSMEPILKNTYGVIVYQEQVMQIVQAVGGFSLGYSDVIRRSMGKKKDMSVYNEQFSKGAEKQGLDYAKASKLFDLIEKFAGYGFNKSHSAAYAMITFQTAYLKTYYPVEFMTALINSVIDDTDKMVGYIKECARMKIKVHAPSVEISDIMFSIQNNEIIFGLKGLKGVGSLSLKNVISESGLDLAALLQITQVNIEAASKKIQKEINALQRKISSIDTKIEKSREKLISYENPQSERQAAMGVKTLAEIDSLDFEQQGLFDQIEVLELEIEKVENEKHDYNKINKREYEALVKSGAFDVFGYTRKFLLDNLALILEGNIPERVDTEFSVSEKMVMEAEVCMIFLNPFSNEVFELEIPEENPIYAIVDKSTRRKKDGSEYTMVKFLEPDGGIVEISDFNNKTGAFNIGDVVSTTIRKNGNYVNLQYIQKLNLSKYAKKTKSTVLKVDLLESVNVSDYSRIEVYDCGNLLCVLER